MLAKPEDPKRSAQRLEKPRVFIEKMAPGRNIERRRYRVPFFFQKSTPPPTFMTPQTINPPELVEHYDCAVPLEDAAVEAVETDHQRPDVSIANTLEGLSLNRIRLRASRRIR